MKVEEEGIEGGRRGNDGERRGRMKVGGDGECRWEKRENVGRKRGRMKWMKRE